MWTFPHFPDWQALTQQYSWIADMQGVPQDAIWHAEGDVYIHTKMVLDELCRLPEFSQQTPQNQQILIAAALLHDVEKRSTTVEEIINGQTRIRSPKHAKKGEFTARCILYRDIATPFAVREQVAKLVRWHGLPLWAIDKANPEKAVIAGSLNMDLSLLAILAKADVLGRICPDKDEILERIALFEVLAKELDCWDKPFAFATSAARFHYLNHDHSLSNYVPFEDFSCEVHMMSGLPASGKDTFIQRHLSDLPMISLDNIRREHRISPTDKKGNSIVAQIGKEQAKIYLRQKQSFVFNATNISAELRGKWLNLFHDYRAKTHIHYIESRYKNWLKQNHQREHQVPEQVLFKLLAKLEMPNFDEAVDVSVHVTE